MNDLDLKAQLSLKRLLPRVHSLVEASRGKLPDDWQTFQARLEANFPRLFRLYYELYSERYDFFFHLEDLLARLARAWMTRPADLKALDRSREAAPLWFQAHTMLGGVCYVDLFAGDLIGIQDRIPYFQELGLTYLHLMPLFKAPPGENDGGYAVSSYREVDPRLGTMEQLTQLAAALRGAGISLVVDLVFNHTSDEHAWAQRAIAGNAEYQDYYRMFSDRSMPDAYETTLREIFPDEHPGAFTYRADIAKWVWTTFHSYQWDLNYANPAVFNSMADEMLFLANAGVEALRLDAVAFIWKELGTSCENLPQAHMLIQAFNAAAQISAPTLVFKSEAIVHPDEVARYIAPQECRLSYNPLLMALLWNSLATRQTRLLDQALRERFRIDPGCAWVNYIRCHDDIGWTFSDEDSARLGIDGHAHRRFLNDFYTGRFEGSFARGLPFQENPKTGDVRISGMAASLAGLEKALREETAHEVDLAVRRILLLHAVILTVGGIPLIYLGDEIGVQNDYTYRDDPAKAGDSRWVHRPSTEGEKFARRGDVQTIEGQIFSGLRRLIELRKRTPAFADGELQVIDAGSEYVLGYLRPGEQRVLCFANFSEERRTIPANILRLYGLGYEFENLVTHQSHGSEALTLDAYEFACLGAFCVAG